MTVTNVAEPRADADARTAILLAAALAALCGHREEVLRAIRDAV